MTKRGRRRSSRRRRSSSSSKQSVSGYIFQKHNKSNSVSYKDDLVEKGQTDCLRKENVKSGSENEERYNYSAPKEKTYKQDYQVNTTPNSKRGIHNKTAEDRETGVKLVTSVSIRDVADSSPKVKVQQSHQPFSEDLPPSATPGANVLKIYCTGSNVKLEICEILHADTSGMKTTVVYINDVKETSLGDKREKMPDNEVSGHHGNQNKSTRFSCGSTSEPTDKSWENPKNFKQPIAPDLLDIQHAGQSVDQCLDVPPPQQFADTQSSEDLTLSLAADNLPLHQKEALEADLEPYFDLLSDSDNYEPMFMRASLSTNRSSFTKDFINCQKRKSWIRNNSIATIEQRTYPSQNKRRQTFPGMSDGLGLMLGDLIVPYSESFSSLVLLSFHLQTERLERTSGSSKLLSEIPSRQNGKRSLHKTEDVFAVSQQTSITYSPTDLKQQYVNLKLQSVSKENCEHEADWSEADDSGFHQVELHSPELLSRELSRPIIPPSCSRSEEPVLESPAANEEAPSVKAPTEQRNHLHLEAGGRAADSNGSMGPEIQTDTEEKPAVSRCHSESKEHLRPVMRKDPDNRQMDSDHWGKRRKLFKETKQEAAGSLATSDITEESVSDDSLDMTFGDNEHRGFYTETFHSSAWIYHGDGVGPGPVPPSLSTRTRTVSIRERTVKISKGTGEYPWGFRIQFSKPIVVTEVDTNGAAEEAGLVVGDYVLAVNGTDVTSIPHSEAAALARQGPDVLTLTVGSDIACCPNTPRPACRGYLHKRTHTGLIKGWRKRWFVLTHDCCLYYYRHKRDEGRRRAVSAVRLEGAEVGQDASLGKPFVFRCRPQASGRVYFFCTTSNQEMKRWLDAMRKAVHPVTQNHVWVDVTRHNANLPPLAVKNPECLGLLHKLDKIKDVWLQYYCILMDGCLYLYSGIRATHAQGGIYLQGYTVREQPYGSKKSTIELKPPSDEFKTFSLCADNPNENERWIVALRASIKKWLPLHQALHDYMRRPAEETRM